MYVKVQGRVKNEKDICLWEILKNLHHHVPLHILIAIVCLIALKILAVESVQSESLVRIRTY